MSYQTNPQSVTTNALITLKNPGTVQNSAPPVAVQVQNASGWILTVQGSGPQQTVQPFTAATILIATGQNLLVTPSFNAYPNLSGYLAAQWLLSKEQATQPDGPLTSAATVASLATLSGVIAQDPNSHAVTNVNTKIYGPYSIATAGALDISLGTGVSISTAKAMTVSLNWLASDQVTTLFQETFTMAPGASSSVVPYNQDDNRRIITPVRSPYLSISAQVDASTSLIQGLLIVALGAASLSKLPDPYLCVAVGSKTFNPAGIDSIFLGAASNTPTGWKHVAMQIPGSLDMWINGSATTGGVSLTTLEMDGAGNFWNTGQINSRNATSTDALGTRTVGRNATLVQINNATGAAAAVSASAAMTPK